MMQTGHRWAFGLVCCTLCTCDCEHGPRPQMPRGVRGKRFGEGLLFVIQVMQNKSETLYRRCPKVSVVELREAMGAPQNAHRATASLARAAPTGGRCARPASSRCTTRPQTRVRTPLVASGSRWLDEQHPLGRLLGPAAAVAAVGLRDSRPPPFSGGWADMDAEGAKMGTRFCNPAAWFDIRHRCRVGELTILFSSLGLATAISTLRARSEATRPGSGL